MSPDQPVHGHFHGTAGEKIQKDSQKASGTGKEPKRRRKSQSGLCPHFFTLPRPGLSRLSAALSGTGPRWAGPVPAPPSEACAGPSPPVRSAQGPEKARPPPPGHAQGHPRQGQRQARLRRPPPAPAPPLKPAGPDGPRRGWSLRGPGPQGPLQASGS